jgi:hypothetical protein
MRHLFLFRGGGRGRPWGQRKVGYRWRLVGSGSVWEEEEESRQAEEGRWQPRKEWADTVKNEDGGWWGWGGVSLGRPAGQGPGRWRPVGRADF